MRRNNEINKESFTSSSGINDEQNQIHTHVVNNFEELAGHASAWNSLTLKSVQQLPMSSYDWVTSFLETQLSPDQDWVVIFAYRGSQLLGVAPLLKGYCRLKGIHRLRLAPPFDWHTPSVDFLVAPGMEKEIIPRLLESANRLGLPLACLKLKRLPLSSPILELMKNKIEHFVSTRHFNGLGSYINTSGDYEKYSAALSRNFRKNLRRLERKSKQLDNPRYLFMNEDTADPEYLKKFMQVESSSWKNRHGTAISQSELKVNFYSALIDKLSKSGWLEWHFLTAGDSAIAAHMAIRLNRKLILLKIGYDEEYSIFSPGTKLLEHTIRRAFESDDIDEIDCLTQYPWNSGWNMQTRKYYDLKIYPARFLSMLTCYNIDFMLNAVDRIPILKDIKHFCGGLHHPSTNNNRHHDAGGNK